jgi:hypothetical protein
MKSSASASVVVAAAAIAAVLVLRFDVRAGVPAACGNDVLEAGEECDPPGSISCPPGSPGGAFLPCNADCTCGSPVPAFLDHFKCYRTREDVRPDFAGRPHVAGTPPVDVPSRKPRFQSRTVDLEDQFTSGPVTVQRPERLCNPVDKNDEGIGDPTAHLVCYDINEPGPFHRRSVVVRNQFGDQTLSLGRPDSLCVPAEKDGVPSPLQLNHFKCYRAFGKSFTTRTVSLDDQFEDTASTVVKPELFCNPVDKDEEGIVDPTAHLTCYRLKTDAPFTPRDASTRDQFGDLDLDVARGECGRAARLCVPSLKNPGTTTTTTPPTTVTTTSTTSTTATVTTTSTSTSTSTSTTPTVTTTSTTATTTSTSTTTSTAPGSPSGAFLD